jgi:hypothetical protein
MTLLLKSRGANGAFKTSRARFGIERGTVIG